MGEREIWIIAYSANMAQGIPHAQAMKLAHEAIQSTKDLLD